MPCTRRQRHAGSYRSGPGHPRRGGLRVSRSSFAIRDPGGIEAKRPDLIILDFMIRGEDYGWELRQKLKMNRATAKNPVIVCTAAVQRVRQFVHQIEGQFNEKAAGTVIEPFDIDDLLRHIEAAWDDTFCVSQAPGR